MLAPTFISETPELLTNWAAIVPQHVSACIPIRIQAGRGELVFREGARAIEEG
jgi:hypothetical protein